MSTARILCAQGDLPIMVEGTITTEDQNGISIACGDDAKALELGAKVVVNVADEDGTRRCVVDSNDVDPSGSRTVGLSHQAIHESDKRDYPRLHAGLPLRYRTVSSSEATAWTSGDPIGGDWVEPDPYMNFSVGGLRFDCTDGLEQGSLVALELQVGEEGKMWNLTATVVRIFDAVGDRPRSAAVSFENLPGAARDALSELTLQIQESLL